MKAIYGIDLGTTYSAIALAQGTGAPEIVPNARGEATTPSVLFFDPSGAIEVGEGAKQKSLLHPSQTAFLVKREMGKEKSKLRKDRLDEFHPFDFQGRVWAPEELSGLILQSLVKQANDRTGLDIKDVVITVPAYFGSLERKATQDAAHEAGLTLHGILNEPTAIALVYGTLEARPGETVLVFDLGGGTLDVTTMQLVDSPEGRVVEVRATDGDRKLGGADWDERIVAWAFERFEEKFSINLVFREDEGKKKCLAELRLEAERAKILLSTEERAEFTISYGGKSLALVLDRPTLKRLTQSLSDSLVFYCNRVLEGRPKSTIDTLILAGSMSHAPMVREVVETWFGKKAKVSAQVDPKYAVALGAAYHAAGLLELAPIEGTAPAEPAPAPAAPAQKKAGAALVHDVIPRSLGLIAYIHEKPVVNILLKGNTPYPVEAVREYGARKAGRDEICVAIVEGDSEKPEQNDQLGCLILRPERDMEVDDTLEVRFAYGDRGILEVSLKDSLSGQFIKQEIRRDGAFIPDGGRHAYRL